MPAHFSQRECIVGAARRRCRDVTITSSSGRVVGLFQAASGHCRQLRCFAGSRDRKLFADEGAQLLEAK